MAGFEGSIPRGAIVAGSEGAFREPACGCGTEPVGALLAGCERCVNYIFICDGLGMTMMR
jgi:hypothetical protein